MARNISVIKEDTTSTKISVDRFPDECGICHKNVTPQYMAGVTFNTSESLQAAFQCTNYECNSIIIGYYTSKNKVNFNLDKHGPVVPKCMEMNEEIKGVSPNFVEIYNQSLHAEQIQLGLISGIGYRKALEFLIKDYLIYLNPEGEEEIAKIPLGQCINKLENENIKELSKRATWIGNDEAHYARKWEDKDINDLKKLIEVTMYFISMHVSTDKYLKEMS